MCRDRHPIHSDLRPALDPGGEDTLACLLEGIGEGVCSVDGAWRIRLVNAAAEEHICRTREEVLGQVLWDVLPKLKGSEVEDSVRRVMEGGGPEEFEHRSLLRSGRWLRLRVFPTPGGLGISFADVTERIRDERALRDSEERLRFAIGVARIGTWDYVPESGDLTWDERCRELSGIPDGHEVDFSAFVAGLHPDDRMRVLSSVDRALDPAGNGAYAVEYRTVGIVDGEERWVSARGRGVFEGGVAVRFVGTVAEVTATKRAAEHQKLLIDELNHRVKNNLSTIQAIAAQAFKSLGNSAQAQSDFTDRLVALAKAHDVLTSQNWDSAFLGDIVANVSEATGRKEGASITSAGPRVRLSPKMALSLAMALHELASNAVRHGALSAPGGHVSLGWWTRGDGTGRTLVLEWIESGGPPVAPPAHRGFGTRLIERGLAVELRGSVRMEYASPGLRCTIEAPLQIAGGDRNGR